MIAEPPNKDQGSHESCFVQSVFSSVQAGIRPAASDYIGEARNRIKNYIKGNMGNSPGAKSLVSRIEEKLQSRHLSKDTKATSKASPF